MSGREAALRGISNHARATPDKAALVMGAATLTYRQLDDRARALARLLASQGAGGPSPVATVLPNGFEILETATAATMLEAPYLPVNWHLKADELGYVLADSGARVAVTDPTLRPKVEEALKLAPRCGPLVLGEGWLAESDRADDVGEGNWGTGEELLAATGPQFMFYTSGTTARPKGVVHGTVPSDRKALVQEGQVALWRWTPKDVYVMTGPAYHAAHGGWASTALYVGATTVIMPSWDAREWMRLVQEHRGTRSFMVPAHFIRLLEVPEAERRRFDLSSLRLIVHAAAPCPVSVKRRLIEALPGTEVHELYGASEGGATRISHDEWLSHPGSVGTPWPGVEVTIRGEGGTPMKTGEQGLIYITSATGARFHYHNDPDSTARAWSAGDSFTVGDIGYVDDEGYLYVTDRQSDMILWGGVNVAPREIEDLLYSHPAVVDCAVFGIPDERDGEHIKAMVELKDRVSEEELASYVRERLADYKVPHEWEVVESLPRDPNGKVLKRRLRQEHWEGQPSR